MLNQTSLGQSWQLGIAVLLAWMGVVAGVDERTLAQSQIVPDQTLGTESSVVTPSGVIRGVRSERIDGGASKGANLFHSFQDFNVGEGRGVYFTNPQGIENILSRVTGTNRSEILGRLGVIGNANLFLLNPNGILLGENASLDVEGSFVATTAEAIALGKQGYFSATQPQQSNLLSVSPGALFFNQAASQPGNIINRGNLLAGKNLTLAGGNLDLQGQLDAGENLTLQATDTAKIRDSAANPFLARSGGNLTIAGNQGLDILALNHPMQTSFVSGGNLSLISDGMISGDARFSSGGSLSIHNSSGGLANFISKYDPIISSNGDVDVAANYTGASLLIESKGNIRIQGDVNITTPDKSALPAGQDSATLSNSTALILRSGQKNLAYGGVNDGSVPGLESGTVPQGITLGGDVSLQRFNGAGGLVSLTTASGDVSTRGITTNGGEIDINSAGAIATIGQTLNTRNGANNGGEISLKATNGNINTGNLDSYSYSTSGSTGNGGAISLKADNGSITTGNLDSSSDSRSGNAGNGSAIALTASGNINTGNLDSYSYSTSGSTGNGDAISLKADNGSITTGILDSSSISDSDSAANGGAITLSAQGSINTGNLFSASASFSDSGQSGNGGAITLEANDRINITDTFNAKPGAFVSGALNSSSFSPNGTAKKGGEINLVATNDINITGNSYAYSVSSEGTGENAGDIRLEAKNGSITTGSLGTDSRSISGTAGNGGAIAFTAGGNITTGGMNSEAQGSGNGGHITLTSNAGAIDTTKGTITSQIRDNSNGTGRPGTIVFTAQDNIQTALLNASAEKGDGSNIQLTSTQGAIDTTRGNLATDSRSGNGGAISLKADNGSITTGILNSSSISDSDSAANGGAITLSAQGSINTGSLFSASASFSDSGQSGNGGAITLEANDRINITDTFNAEPGAFVSGALNSSSFSPNGTAKKGSEINLVATNDINITGNSYAYSLSFIGIAANAGDIRLEAKNGSITTGSLGTDSRSISGTAGNGGEIILKASNTITTNSLLSRSYSESGEQGSGGSIDLNATNTIKTDAINSTGGLGSGNINITSKAAFALKNGTIYSDTFGSGKGGDIKITAPSISLTNGAQVSASTHSSGIGGNIILSASDKVELSGATTKAPRSDLDSGLPRIPDGAFRGGYVPNGVTEQLSANTLYPSGVFTQATDNSTGSAGNLKIETGQLIVKDRGAISTTTFGQGNAGNISVIKADSILVDKGSILSGVEEGAIGSSGKIDMQTRSLDITQGGILQTRTLGQGKAGEIDINATDKVNISGAGSGLSSGSGDSNNLLGNASSNIGQGGNIKVMTNSLRVVDGAVLDAQTQTNSKGGNITVEANTLSLENDGKISALSEERGNAGSINIDVTGLLSATDSKIVTSATQSSGGAIAIKAGDIRLYGNSNITTNVGSGTGSGGKIKLTADSIIAFDDSDILTFASGGIGGDIEFNSPAFFGQNYKPAPTDTAPRILDGNNRVDINASGAVSGVITLPDTSLIQNSISELPENLIDTSNLIANSCIARSRSQQQGNFTITGSGGLPTRPGDALMSLYNFGNVRSVSNTAPSANSTRRPWSQGDPIVEPQGVYQLSSGQMVLSRECP